MLTYIVTRMHVPIHNRYVHFKIAHLLSFIILPSFCASKFPTPSFQASGLSQLCNGSGMPPGLSELVVAQQALGGVGLALLRQQRTGQGQFVQATRGLLRAE